MKLNKTQKVILIIYSLIFVLICIYVPWLGKRDIAVGYAPIWVPQQHFQYQTLDSRKLVQEKKGVRQKLLLLKQHISEKGFSRAKQEAILEQFWEFQEFFPNMKEDYSKFSIIKDDQKYSQFFTKKSKELIEQLEQRVQLSESDFEFYKILAEKIDLKRLIVELFATTVLFGAVFVSVSSRRN